MNRNRCLNVSDVHPTVYRGNLSTKVVFAGEEGEKHSLKELVERIIQYPARYVVLTGTEPTKQHMRDLVYICFILKRKYFKKVLVETDASRFNQLLFINVKHFIVKPRREIFNPVKFKRYVENSSHKSLLKWRTPDLSCNDKATYRNFVKFVEFVFEIRDYEDMQFASKLFKEYDLKGNGVKVFIKRECPEPEFAKAWEDHRESFLPYNYLYILE